MVCNPLMSANALTWKCFISTSSINLPNLMQFMGGSYFHRRKNWCAAKIGKSPG